MRVLSCFHCDHSSWLFNRVWVGRFKLPLLPRKVFAGSDENSVDGAIQVIGIDHNGEQKAFPVNMIFWHHQVPDEIDGDPI